MRITARHHIYGQSASASATLRAHPPPRLYRLHLQHPRAYQKFLPVADPPRAGPAVRDKADTMAAAGRSSTAEGTEPQGPRMTESIWWCRQPILSLLCYTES